MAKQIFEVEVQKILYATVPVLAETEEDAKQYVLDNGIDSSYLQPASENEWAEWETTDRVFDGSTYLENYDCQNWDQEQESAE